MSITMYDKTTGKNVKVYGFVQANMGMYGSLGVTYAVTYRLKAKTSLETLKQQTSNEQAECSADDLKLELVPAKDLRPLDMA